MRRAVTGRLFLLMFLVAFGVSAAEPGRVTLALSGGRVIDGYEGRPIEDGVVLIAGDRIAAVGPRSQLSVPAGVADDRHARHEHPAGARRHARSSHDHRPRRLRALGQDLPLPLSRRDHAGRGEAARHERRDVRPRARRAARGHPRRQAADRVAARSPVRGSSSPARSSSTSPTPSTRRSSAGASPAPPTRGRKCRRSSTRASTSSSSSTRTR